MNNLFPLLLIWYVANENDDDIQARSKNREKATLLEAEILLHFLPVQAKAKAKQKLKTSLKTKI